MDSIEHIRAGPMALSKKKVLTNISLPGNGTTGSRNRVNKLAT